MRYVVNDAGCWLWTGPTYGREGEYGYVYVGSKTLPVHRASYELFVGPIPPGWEVDHLCRTTLCMNPAHLEAVVKAVNNERSTRWPVETPVESDDQADLDGVAIPEDRRRVCKNGHVAEVRRVCKACARARAKRYRVAPTQD